jgi:AcrR family transcriptional regulator
MATRTPPRSPQAPVQERRSARERLLSAAEELFYGEGINTVGIDRVIERAGVAKASLYDAFGSKEELIRSYLAARHAGRKARMEEKLARYANPREKLLGIFDAMAEMMAAPDFKGCAFVRAGSELRSTPSVQAVVEESRTWLRGLFRDLAREAGAVHPDRLAQQLVILYDGASIAAQMDGDLKAAARAKAMAETLLDTEVKPAAKRR